MNETPIADLIRSRFSEFVISVSSYRGNETVSIKSEGLLRICEFLKNDPKTDFNFLIDITCVDYLSFGKAAYSSPTLSTPSPLPYFMNTVPSKEAWQPIAEGEFRFEVIYHLYSLESNRRLRLKLALKEDSAAVNSLTGVWKAANWFEREVYDMFGVHFMGHPNLKRILMYDSFEGHPLRKDYPVNKRQPLIGPVN
jgi:NADH-quinone oxidoreductase subunit C